MTTCALIMMGVGVTLFIWGVYRAGKGSDDG